MIFGIESSKSRADPIGLAGAGGEQRLDFWRKQVEFFKNPEIFQTSFQWPGNLPRGSRRGPWLANHGFHVQNSMFLWKSRFSKNSRKVIGKHDFLTFPEPLDLRSRGPVGAARFSSKWLAEQVYLDRRVISEQRKLTRRSNGIMCEIIFVVLDVLEIAEFVWSEAQMFKRLCYFASNDPRLVPILSVWRKLVLRKDWIFDIMYWALT